jgi:hypothetical protein
LSVFGAAGANSQDGSLRQAIGHVIARGTGHRLRSDDAAAARLVLHQHGGAKHLRKALGDVLDVVVVTDDNEVVDTGPDGGCEVDRGGMARPEVLQKLGLEGYNGWAFGFGLERLAMISMELPDIRLLRSTDERVKAQLVLGSKFKEVSKFPPITRDISFVVASGFEPNNYFDLIRDIGGDLIEQVELLDTYADPKKFGEGKTSYTFRVVYRSHDRTLRSEEVDALQAKLYEETKGQFAAEVR